MSPKISILCPSYNHEKFVGYFIESVLNQTFLDFELLIIDDYSTDRNVEEIKKFKDSRIKLITHSFNQGINASLNTAFKYSSGEILVFCGSDDRLLPNALELMYSQITAQNVVALYSKLEVIDEDNHPIKKYITPEEKTRYELLHYFFMEGNCLTSPGMCIKREVIEHLYPLNLAMCNHQDTQVHILLLLQGEVGFLQTPLVQYRRMSLQSKYKNISAKDEATLKRVDLEIHSLMDTFLRFKDVALLKQVFKEEIQSLKVEPYEDTLEFFLGFMALQSPYYTRKVWGYHSIMRFVKSSGFGILKSRYNFTFKDYLALIDYMGKDKILSKYQKYKRLFNMGIIVLGISLVLNIILVLF